VWELVSERMRFGDTYRQNILGSTFNIALKRTNLIVNNLFEGMTFHCILREKERKTETNQAGRQTDRQRVREFERERERERQREEYVKYTNVRQKK
jgi:hypothetical protein